MCDDPLYLFQVTDLYRREEASSTIQHGLGESGMLEVCQHQRLRISTIVAIPIATRTFGGQSTVRCPSRVWSSMYRPVTNVTR